MGIERTQVGSKDRAVTKRQNKMLIILINQIIKQQKA